MSDVGDVRLQALVTASVAGDSRLTYRDSCRPGGVWGHRLGLADVLHSL
jgi:hypothetical protein